MNLVITRFLMPTLARLVQRPPLAALAILMVIGHLVAMSIQWKAAVAGREQVLPDTRQYVTLASNVVTKGEFTLDGEYPSARREPGYVTFVAAFMKLGVVKPFDSTFVNLWPVIMLQILFFGVASFGIARLAEKRYGPVEGLLSLLFAQVYWPVASQQHLALSETLTMVCLAGAWLTLGDWRRLNGSWLTLLTGAAFLGIACITKSIFVLAMPLFVLFLWLRARVTLIRCATLAVLVLAMPMAWTARNAHHFHLPIMGSIDGVSSMYRGNVLPFIHLPSPEDPAMPSAATKALAMMKTDGERYIWYKAHAMEIMKREPVRYGLQCMNRVIYMLTEHDVANDPAWRALLLIKSDNFLSLLLLVIHLPVLFRRQKASLHVEGTLLMFISTLGLYGLVYGETRYLVPWQFMMAPLYAAAASDRIILPLLARFAPALLPESNLQSSSATCASA